MTEEIQLQNRGIKKENEDLYVGMERSQTLLQEQEQAKQNMLTRKDDVDAIQQFISASENSIAQLQAEKKLLVNKSKDNKDRWVKSNTYIMDLNRRIEYLEDQLRARNEGQLQGINANQSTGNKDFAEHTRRENLKQRLSSHFRESLKHDKW